MVTAQDLVTEEFVKVDVADTVSSLLGALRKAGAGNAVVFDGKEYRGVVSKRWLLSSHIDPSSMKVGNITKHRSKAKTQFFVPHLSPSTDLKEICRLFSSTDSHILPVIDKEHFVGVVSLHEVLDAVRDSYKKVPIESVASSDVKTIAEDASISKAITLFSDSGVDRLPVVSSVGKLVGILSLAEVVQHAIASPQSGVHISSARSHQGRKFGGTGSKDSVLTCPVSNAMQSIVCTCKPATKVADAIGMMKDSHVHSVVIVKDGVPVGIMTASDVVRHFLG